LPSGCTLSDLHYTYGIGILTLSKIIPEVCKTIWEELKLSGMTLPSQADWLQIVQQFEQRANLPNYIGCINGKHVRIVKPADSGSLYYNYKHFF
jgi:hypothetical protein